MAPTVQTETSDSCFSSNDHNSIVGNNNFLNIDGRESLSCLVKKLYTVQITLSKYFTYTHALSF